MHLIDTHAHIYLPEFAAERREIIERAKSNNLGLIVMPAIDSSTHLQMLEAESEFDICISMIGLHPCSVKNNFEIELNIVRQWLKKRSFIAVGETGLDFYWDKTFADEQYAAFHQQIELGSEYELPIVIHSRNSIEECISVIRQYRGIRGIFHCFSGTAAQAEKIIELGFLLGIGGVLTFKNSGLDKSIQHVDLKNMVLETDAPYLSPVPFRGQRNEPGYITYVAKKLAELKKITTEEVVQITTANSFNLFDPTLTNLKFAAL